MDEKEYWELLEKYAILYSTTAQQLHASIPDDMKNSSDKISAAANVAGILFNQGYLPYQIHTMLACLIR